MNFGPAAGIACVTLFVAGSTLSLVFLAGKKSVSLDLPRTKYANQFTLGRNEVIEYRLDNRDGAAVKLITASLEAQGGRKRVADGHLVFDMNNNQTVSVQVPPVFLGTSKGVSRYRTAGGREYVLRGKTRPTFSTLQVVVTTPRPEILSMISL